MKRVLILLAFFAAAACGFRPVHSADLSGAKSGSIYIVPLAGRSGHVLRRELNRELATGLPGIDEAILRIEFDERLVRLPLTPDGAAARTDIQASANYVLDTGEEAITGEVTAESSFNVPIAAFGDISAQTAASERAMRVLAQRLSADLRLQVAAEQ